MLEEVARLKYKLLSMPPNKRMTLIPVCKATLAQHQQRSQRALETLKLEQQALEGDGKPLDMERILQRKRNADVNEPFLSVDVHLNLLPFVEQAVSLRDTLQQELQQI